MNIRLLTEHDAALYRAFRLRSLQEAPDAFAIASDNQAASRLYTSLGFRVYGLEPYALKRGEVYLDEEFMVLSLKR